MVECVVFLLQYQQHAANVSQGVPATNVFDMSPSSRRFTPNGIPPIVVAPSTSDEHTMRDNYTQGIFPGHDGFNFPQQQGVRHLHVPAHIQNGGVVPFTNQGTSGDMYEELQAARIALAQGDVFLQQLQDELRTAYTRIDELLAVKKSLAAQAEQES